jgi:hypothetical protein
MVGRNKKKKQKRLDLLEVSNVERIRMIRMIRDSLRQKVVEEKLWKSLVESESVTINGQTIGSNPADLKGFSRSELKRNASQLSNRLFMSHSPC